MRLMIAGFMGALLINALAAAQAGQIFTTQPPGGAPGIPVPSPQGPPRDTAPKTGTSIIRGRVFAAESGQPLRKAFVRANAPDLREGRVATTDEQGRYELKELPAGRYTLNASKGSYVSLMYGQTRPLEGGKPLEILDHQTIERVDFNLPRGAIITGRVVDEFGDPVADTQVSPMRSMNQGGRRRMMPAGRGAMTNDIGEYRLFGLPPGQYYISATLRANMMFNAQSEDRSGYAPTYYPAATSVAEAQRLTVGLAQTLTDINIALLPTRTARVSGTAVDAQGKPLSGGNVMVFQRNLGMGVGFMNAGGMIRPDGTFTISSLPPGEYTLQATVPSGGDQPDVATTQVTVNGDDVNGIQLIASRPSMLTGRIVFSDPSAASSVRPGMVRPMAQAKNPDDNMFMMGGGGPGKVNDDFTFEAKSRPGTMIIRIMGIAPPGWTLKAVRINNTDVTDEGFQVRAGQDIGDIEIEMTNHPSDVSGTVTNARGEALKDYSVIVFAQDRDRWDFGSRYLRTGRPDQDGRFKVAGLPPGSYYAIAVDYIEPGDASDPEYLERVVSKATRFSIAEGETKTLDLKITASS